MSAYENVVLLGQKKYGLSVKFKDQSYLMKILGFLLFFNPKFMTSYTTVLGNTVYFPSQAWLAERKDASARVLAHELVHISDYTSAGSFVFSVGYMFPQILSLLSVFSFFSSSWWLLSLLFLLPIPAPARTYYELRGYALTDAVSYKKTGKFVDIAWLKKQFTSSAYFFMWPFEVDLENRIEKNRELIKSGKLSEKISCADEIISCFE